MAPTAIPAFAPSLNPLLASGLVISIDAPELIVEAVLTGALKSDAVTLKQTALLVNVDASTNVCGKRQR